MSNWRMREFTCPKGPASLAVLPSWWKQLIAQRGVCISTFWTFERGEPQRTLARYASAASGEMISNSSNDIFCGNQPYKPSDIMSDVSTLEAI